MNSRNIQFYSLLTILILLFAFATFRILVLLAHHTELTSLFLVQCMNTLSCYFLLGIGIGLPVIILATILGWLQLILLLSGNVNPHLAKEGFFKVLGTLFTKI